MQKRGLFSQGFEKTMAAERQALMRDQESVRTFDRDRLGALRNFPVQLALEFDSRRMGALTFGDFARFALETGVFYSEREKRENYPEVMLRELRKYFLYLDTDKDGLISLLDADRQGNINDFSRMDAFYKPALQKGKPYASGKNGDAQSIIAKAAKLHMDCRLESIIKSREALEHAGAYIYKYTVPILCLAKEQEGMSILHMSDIHFNRNDGQGRNEQKLDFLSTLKHAIAPPDIVMVTGDLVTARKEDFMKTAQDALGGLFKNALRALVHGNHDIEQGAEGEISQALGRSGYVDLTNRHIGCSVRGMPFHLTGVDDKLRGMPRLPDIPKQARLEPHVLATHSLDAVDGSYPGCFDIVLSGHTHLGEANYLLFDGYDYLRLTHAYENINRLKDEWGVASQRTVFHITSGLGSHTTRFNSTPEGVTLITLACG